MWTEILNFLQGILDQFLDPFTYGIVTQVFDFVRNLFGL